MLDIFLSHVSNSRAIFTVRETNERDHLKTERRVAMTTDYPQQYSIVKTKWPVRLA